MQINNIICLVTGISFFTGFVCLIIGLFKQDWFLIASGAGLFIGSAITLNAEIE